MKSFKKYIKESSGFPTGPVGENPNNVGGALDANPSEVANPAVLRRLSAIVGQIGNHEYLVAEHAIERLRGTLNKIGLSFPATPTMEGTSLCQYSIMYEKITSENVLMFAIRHYNNPHCEGEKEFEDDLKRFKYIKRLLRKYYDTGILKERLLLNHIIVLHNVFGPDACATLLMYKIQPEYWSALKTFLLFLNILKEEELSHITIDETVDKILKEL